MKLEHMWHRDKTLSREASKELRDLWNCFDPIGVCVHDDDDVWPVDEYDNYHTGTLRCLQSDHPPLELDAFIRHSVAVNMGLGEEFIRDEEYVNFIKKLVDWFKSVEQRTMEAVHKA